MRCAWLNGMRLRIDDNVEHVRLAGLGCKGIEVGCKGSNNTPRYITGGIILIAYVYQLELVLLLVFLCVYF